MTFLVDTDVLIYHLNDVKHATEFLDRLLEEPAFISTISYIEVLEGIPRSPQPVHARTQFTDLVASIGLLPFGEPEARRCAALRESLRRDGRPVRRRALDLMIAATAIEHGLTLATNNLATNNADDYRDIPGLQIEPLT